MTGAKGDGQRGELDHAFDAGWTLIEHFLDEHDLNGGDAQDGDTLKEGPPLDSSVC